MKKTLLVIALVLLFITGCNGQIKASSKDRFDYMSSNNVDGYSIRVIRDKKTGCQYVFTTGSGTAITPMLNSDGKPLCE